jgi:Notch-like protein
MCKVGFEGQRCEVNFDDCKNNKCKNGAECIDLVGSYECKCAPGFMGDFCEKKIEKCASFPCRNGNSIKKLQLAKDSVFLVDNLFFQIKTSKGTCEELALGFTCHCDKGFTGQFCENLIDKCDPSPCKNGATCHNLIDDYYCACLPEFGLSRNCTERSIDPCITSPCLNNATCTAISSFSKEKNAPIFKGFSCRCPQNYRGELCEQPIDICSSNPCKNHGRCTIPKENPNDYKCLCFPAFTGKACEFLFDECASFPCNNGGKCLPSPEGYKCKCPFNFGGKT